MDKYFKEWEKKKKAGSERPHPGGAVAVSPIVPEWVTLTLQQFFIHQHLEHVHLSHSCIFVIIEICTIYQNIEI